MSTLGERVAAERARKDWSQTRLAQEVNRHCRTTGEKPITWSSIQKLESRGTQTPRFIKALALALGVEEHWLRTEKGARYPQGIPVAQNKGKVPVVGYIGAGAAVEFFDAYPKGGALSEVACPRGLRPDKTVAVIVRGESQAPLINDGWLIFYSRDPEPDAAEVLGKLSVVRTADGLTMLKRVRRGPTVGKFNLESANAPIMEDVALEWAAPVKAILPPELADDTA